MKKFPKAVPAIVALLAIVAGAWSFAPGAPVLAQGPSDTPTPGAVTETAPAATAVSETPTAAASAQPSATAATNPSLQSPSGISSAGKQLLESLYTYSPDFSNVSPAGFSQEDRAALDVLWAQNAGALQMLRLAASRSRSAPVRELLRLMYQMHLQDQALLDQFEHQVSTCAAGSGVSNGGTNNGGTSASAANSPTGNVGSGTDGNTDNSAATPTTAATAAATEAPSCPTGSYKPGDMGASGAALSLTNVHVLPGSPLGMLGFKTFDLKAAFMDKVSNVPSTQFDRAFIPQMIAAHSFSIETAQSIQVTAADSALRDLAGHLAQVDSIHNLLMLQLSDRLYYGQNLGIRFPSVTPGTGQTPTAAPSATESVTPAPSETATVPAMTETPSAQETTTGTPAVSETPSAQGSATGTPATTETASAP